MNVLAFTVRSAGLLDATAPSMLLFPGPPEQELHIRISLEPKIKNKFNGSWSRHHPMDWKKQEDPFLMRLELER